MTKKNKVDFSQVAAHVIKSPLENFVEDSYLPYAHYVIRSRALISDDGLKPVQRRILYAMDQLGLTDKKPHIKATQIIGETMGKYHPHGDSSIEDAIGRLAQDFSVRVPLVDGHGNLGYTTGDEAAAARYWEGRPTRAAIELTSDLKKGAIEMGVSYDGRYAEPAMLPAKWPVGIINGSQGIAVGYSSNVISHNPGEVMDALIALVKNPDLTIDELLEIMPGPDMATGGVLMEEEGVREYYETGKGKFVIRGKYRIQPGARGTHQILFDEAPYQISAEQIARRVNVNKERGRFKEVSYVKDLSDKDNGFLVSFGIKAGANPEVVLKDIFKWTPLEQNFSANMNVLRYGAPKVSPMLDLLQNFIDFRSECIVNKTNYRLNEIKDELNRLSGIIAVLVDIDKAIEIIRNSDDTKEANEKLMKDFNINTEQADYILSMPLRRLTKSDSASIKEQIQELEKEEKFLSGILKDDDKFDEYFINELNETKKIIDDERRTEINHQLSKELEAEAEALKLANKRFSQNAEYYVTIFANDTITRTFEPYKQERSPTAIVTEIKVKIQENLIFVARDGSALRIPATHIPEDTIMDLDVTTGLPENAVVGAGVENLGEDGHGTLLITSKGGVNVVDGGYPVSDSFQTVKLDDDEDVIAAYSLTKEDNEEKSLVLISSDAYAVKFPVEQVRTSNSGAGTVRGMNLSDGATIVGASVADSENSELVSCTHKTMKVTELKEIPGRNRNAKGVILQTLGKEDEIISAFTSERVIANKNGRSLRLPEASERTAAGTDRAGSGVILGHFGINV